MERFQLIRKMYLQGTISMSAAIILAATDEERQEIRDLTCFIEYQEERDAEKDLEIAYSWVCYYNIYDHYCDECFALERIYKMSRTSNQSNYCGMSRFKIGEMYTDYYEDIADDFDYAVMVRTLRKQTGIMTSREQVAYNMFNTHAKEREIAEEWIAGNIVSVPRGLDYTYITSHYHTLLPYHPH